MPAPPLITGLRRWALLLIVAGSWVGLYAQTDHNANLWLRGSVEVQTSERWLVRHENYFRRSEWGGIWQQIVSRSALQYRYPTSMLWSVGYAFHIRYPYGEYNPSYTHFEHQFLLMHHFTPKVAERIQPLLRTRFEYRWLERQRSAGDESRGHQVESYFVQSARVRLQLGLMFTLNRAKTWRYEVFNEDFFNLNRPIYRQYIAQNRLMTGFTYKLNPNLSVSAWFLHQWIGPTTPQDEQNHTLFLGINWRIKAFRRPPPPPEAPIPDG